MLDFSKFKYWKDPFPHWVGEGFVDKGRVEDINASWPGTTDDRWIHERRDYTRKSAIMFPNKLHPQAQALAAELYTAESIAALSSLTKIENLLPDPWFLEGPLIPRVGGGLHEIHPGGLLKMHVDFSTHPTGLTRTLNLLIYLNLGWKPEWGGALRLENESREIVPYCGTAVVFETTGSSWHGHPLPLQCPVYRSRRSLALYYYRAIDTPPERITTVYRK